MIGKADDKFVELFYEVVKSYLNLENRSQMIQEAEQHIEEGRTYNLKEAKEDYG